MKPRPLFIPHVPFDPVLAEPCFPPVRQVPQEQEEAFQQVGKGYYDRDTIVCIELVNPTSIASVHLVMGYPNARAGVKIVRKRTLATQILTPSLIATSMFFRKFRKIQKYVNFP